MSRSILLMFSPKNFIVFSLTFRSLIHFEFIFVCGVREYSNFIAVQFSQHHLLKVLSFLQGVIYSCLLCHRLIDCRCVGLFLGFCPVPSGYVDDFEPILHCLMAVALEYSPKSRSLIPPTLCFFLRIALAI